MRTRELEEVKAHTSPSWRTVDRSANSAKEPESGKTTAEQEAPCEHGTCVSILSSLGLGSASEVCGETVHCLPNLHP